MHCKNAKAQQQQPSPRGSNFYAMTKVCFALFSPSLQYQMFFYGYCVEPRDWLMYEFLHTPSSFHWLRNTGDVTVAEFPPSTLR